MSTTAVASASPASDAAAAMARVAQLQQMLAEAAQGPAASLVGQARALQAVEDSGADSRGSGGGEGGAIPRLALLQ